MLLRPSDPAADRRLGIALALLAMLMFSLNDVLGKWLVASYSVGQLLLLRSTAAVIVLAPMIWRARGRLWPLEQPGLQALRVLAASVEVYAFYYAVITLPLADAMTYWLAAPIYVAAASPWLLGERVGPWRWGAIAAGFVGVVVALRPGTAEFGLPMVVSLIGSMAFAFMILASRALRGTPDAALVFWQTLGPAAVGLITAPFDWVAPSPRDFGLLATLGVVSTLAHILVNRSLKLADAATIAPLQYTLLLWAIAFGWAIWGSLPGPAILAGAAIIIASGLVIWFRETRAHRRALAH